MHAATELRRGGVCQADAGPVSERTGNTVLWRAGPAPTRGASTRRSEDRFYASWRELCGVKLSAHDPLEGEGGLWWLATCRRSSAISDRAC